MKKYISAIITVFLVFNLQTYLSAKESYEKKEAKTSFEQFLPSKNFTAQDLKNLLSDNSSISLEKIFLPPIKKVNNADMPQQLFPEEDYYEVYKRVLTNPSSSSDFNLTKQDLTNSINNYKNKIVELLKNSYAFRSEKTKNPNTTLSDFINKIVNKNINLLAQYYKENPSLALYENQENTTQVNIKKHKDWSSDFLHQKMLIEIAALRVIEANLRYAKAGLTYDLALFDIISIARTSAIETQINFNNGILTFTIPQEAYKYIPFGTLKLVSRDTKFMTALQEIEKKKQNPAYDFASKTIKQRPSRAEDYTPPTPSVYDSPWGAGSVR